MKARTIAVARGERRVSREGPKVWFTPTESFAKILSVGNRELLRVIAEKAPGSLEELARMTGRPSPISPALCGPWKVTAWSASSAVNVAVSPPKVMHDRVELDLPLTPSRKAS